MWVYFLRFFPCEQQRNNTDTILVDTTLSIALTSGDDCFHPSTKTFHFSGTMSPVEFAVSWEWSSSVWRGPATCKSHRYHFQVLGFWRFSQPPSFLEDKQFKFTFPRLWPLPQTKIFLSVIITNNLHSWDNATMLALFSSLI